MHARDERRSASTRFLRVPTVDWPAVAAGEKRQVRLVPAGAPRFHRHMVPSPIVAYASARNGVRGEVYIRGRQLMVLESFKIEPLIAISKADLEAEGFEDLVEYRRYWNAHRGGFRPMFKVIAYSIRPMEPGEEEEFALTIFRHLYGPWLRELVEPA